MNNITLSLPNFTYKDYAVNCTASIIKGKYVNLADNTLVNQSNCGSYGIKSITRVRSSSKLLVSENSSTIFIDVDNPLVLRLRCSIRDGRNIVNNQVYLSVDQKHRDNEFKSPLLHYNNGVTSVLFNQKNTYNFSQFSPGGVYAENVMSLYITGKFAVISPDELCKYKDIPSTEIYLIKKQQEEFFSGWLSRCLMNNQRPYRIDDKSGSRSYINIDRIISK